MVAGGFLLIAWLVRVGDGPRSFEVLVWLSLIIGLAHGVVPAVEALRNRRFDIDVLMVAGAAMAAYIGAPAEGALLLFLFLLSGALEALATARTTRAVESLHALMPTTASRWESSVGQPWSEAGEPAGSWVTLEPERLVPGDVVRVLPGEQIPTDGRVILGESAIDQASLTGESMPRSVVVGDDCFAGTINTGNPLRIRVTKPATESSLQRVLDLVVEAQSQRAPVQRLIDKVSQPYAISVFAVSVITVLVWWLALGVEWRSALYTGITLLIVGSPCAVILATPTATLAGIARGARAGVLFKGGQSVDRLARLGAVAFDKTGTLTVGKPRVERLEPVGWSDQSRLLSVAACLEQESTHPIATAVREAAVAMNAPTITGTEHAFHVGRGVSATIAGQPARLGTYVFVEPIVPECLKARVREVLDATQSAGRIATVVAHDQQAGVIILADTVRPGASELVRELHALNVRPVVMLTGDNRATAQSVATALGLDQARAELLPGDKVAAVEELKSELARTRPGTGVGVIGDGVNDAPALASSDVSIAIGSIGSDAALESADIVLLADDLRVVPWAVGLARRTRRTIQINLGVALGAIVVMELVTLIGSRTGWTMPLWMGVLGHEGGTLLVVFHSLLLLAYRSPTVQTLESVRSGVMNRGIWPTIPDTSPVLTSE